MNAIKYQGWLPRWVLYQMQGDQMQNPRKVERDLLFFSPLPFCKSQGSGGLQDCHRNLGESDLLEGPVEDVSILVNLVNCQKLIILDGTQLTILVACQCDM